MVFKRLGDIFSITALEITKEKRPRHLIITLEDGKDAELGSFEELFAKRNSIVMGLIETQAKLKIPVLTIQLMSSEKKSAEHIAAEAGAISELLGELSKAEVIHANNVKVSVLGKWYDLPGQVVDSVKSVIDSTASYDHFFLNFCVNYSGRQEIVDACKLIARRVKAEREDPDTLTEAGIKESLYSSSVIPPELIIKNGGKKLPDVLLWDSPGARVYFSGKHWSEFGKVDFIRALNT